MQHIHFTRTGHVVARNYFEYFLRMKIKQAQYVSDPEIRTLFNTRSGWVIGR